MQIYCKIFIFLNFILVNERFYRLATLIFLLITKQITTIFMIHVIKTIWLEMQQLRLATLQMICQTLRMRGKRCVNYKFTNEQNRYCFN